MSVNIPNIDIAAHQCLPSSCNSYWQEVGRCACDGRWEYAVCYAFKRSQSSFKDGALKELALLMDNQSLQMLEMTGECSVCVFLLM
ncbi:hypothetical protein ACJMK2_014415 [Sinanodonta woodiana]|uniref:Uncharacterized protein n=1 Tax=Sinanodonta woodiana TaxID=1069815 RepID=A0ABD3V1C3_SINWO